MLKKILYIIVSFLVGFMLLSSIVVTNFYSTFQGLIVDEVNNKEYTNAERFFSRVVDEKKFYSLEQEGTMIEVYLALNDNIKPVYDEEGKATSTTYYTLDSCLQFSLFNLPDDFALVDNKTDEANKKQGGVKLVLGDNGSLFFPFVNELVDYYSFVASYSYLPFSIPYEDYVAALDKADIDLKAAITSAVVIDGDGEEEFVVEFAPVNRPTFNNQFHHQFIDILTRYNKVQLQNAKGEEVDTEETKKIVEDYNAVLEKNPGYLQQYDFSVIYSSSDFLLPVIGAAVIFLALDVLLGWFIFRKKKASTYVPPYKAKQTQAPTRQPEQFSRDVFNVEEDDVVETPVEETPVEEVKPENE
jgi:hypothetical protein